ncbi:MAG: hypothetical protein Q9195_003598, partial [Heterodermia aff. obscurata]
MSSQSAQSAGSAAMPSSGQLPASMAGMIDIGEMPLAPPPRGIVPNLVNPESRDNQVYIIAGVFMGLMLVFLALRIYAKIGVQKARGWDDFALYGLVIFLIKATILMLFLKLFGRLRWMKLAVWVGLISSGIFYSASFIVFFVLCGPSGGKDWLEVSQTQRCQRSDIFGVIQGAFNVLSDFALLLLPLPAVWALKLPVSKRLGVCAIFMTGLLACIVSVITLWLRIDELDFYDRTWDVITLWLMTIVEMNVGLIVACMPAVATVVRAHSPLLARLWTSIGSKLPSIEVKVSVRRPRGSRDVSERYRPSAAGSGDVERGGKMVEVRAESRESGESGGGRNYR